jgi:zinc transport system ATP-binding protein
MKPDPSAVPILQFDSVSFAYPGEPKPIFQNLSWQLPKGTWCSILGPNGAGKTTLLQLIAGLKAPTSGRVGRNYSPSRMIYVPQYASFEGTQLRVADLVSLCLRSVPQLSLSLDLWKHTFGIPPIWNQPIHHLSVGQKQRLTLGLYLLKPAEILLLDEPTSGCDIAHANEIYKLVETIRQELALTVVHVSHEIHQVLMFAKEVICLGLEGHWHRHVGEISYESLEHAYGCELGKLIHVHEQIPEESAHGKGQSKP